MLDLYSREWDNLASADNPAWGRIVDEIDRLEARDEYTLQVLEAEVREWSGPEFTVTQVRTALRGAIDRLKAAWAIAALAPAQPEEKQP